MKNCNEKLGWFKESRGDLGIGACTCKGREGRSDWEVGRKGKEVLSPKGKWDRQGESGGGNRSEVFRSFPEQSWEQKREEHQC